MEAELLKELDKTDEKAVRQLVEECNAYDHTAYDSDLDGDFYYLVRNDDPEESGVDSPLFAILSGYKLGETIDGQDVHDTRYARYRHVYHVLPEPPGRFPRLPHSLHAETSNRSI